LSSKIDVIAEGKNHSANYDRESLVQWQLRRQRPRLELAANGPGKPHSWSNILFEQKQPDLRTSTIPSTIDDCAASVSGRLGSDAPDLHCGSELRSRQPAHDPSENDFESVYLEILTLRTPTHAFVVANAPRSEG